MLPAAAAVAALAVAVAGPATAAPAVAAIAINAFGDAACIVAPPSSGHIAYPRRPRLM